MGDLQRVERHAVPRWQRAAVHLLEGWRQKPPLTKYRGYRQLGEPAQPPDDTQDPKRSCREALPGSYECY